MKDNKPGNLYLVATPIGNLADISQRAIDTLRCADIIAAEDTRHSRIITQAYGIDTPLTSYHEHNKYEQAQTLIDAMKDGKSVAVITDAGTPAISDPGEVLADMAIKEGIKVSSVPGACALITALTMSGMNARRFIFEGFLPADKKETEEVLASIKSETRTVIMYEAPHRLKKTLALLSDRLGERRVAICRELTKVHEECIRMSLSEAAAYYEEHEPRGEYVLVIEGISREQAAQEAKSEWQDISVKEHFEKMLSQGLDKKEAMKAVAAQRGCSKRDIYQQLLEE